MKQLSSRQIKAAMLASGPSWTDEQLIARTEARAKEVREDCYLYRWKNGVIVITQEPGIVRVFQAMGWTVFWPDGVTIDNLNGEQRT